MRIKIVVFIIAIMLLTSCQKSIESFKKGFQTTDRNYIIEQYSGGELIGKYKFKGTLNDSENSDGYYFFEQDTLVEISGDIIIRSTN